MEFDRDDLAVAEAVLVEEVGGDLDAALTATRPMLRSDGYYVPDVSDLPELEVDLGERPDGSG